MTKVVSFLDTIITEFYPSLYLVSHDYLSATVDTVFCPASIHASKQRPKIQKIEKGAKLQISKPKRVKIKNKINVTWSDSGSKGDNI